MKVTPLASADLAAPCAKRLKSANCNGDGILPADERLGCLNDPNIIHLNDVRSSVSALRLDTGYCRAVLLDARWRLRRTGTAGRGIELSDRSYR